MPGQAPRYTVPSAPTATRLTEEVRRILDWLVLTSDADSVSDYIRRIIEQHLVDLGFTLVEGVHRGLPLAPARDEIVQWEVNRDDKPRRAVG